MDTPPTFNLHLDFDDVDALSESVVDWDIEFRQLKRGLFTGKLSQVGRDGWAVGRAKILKSTEQVGLAPAGLRTIAIGGAATSAMKWRSREVGGNELAIFPENGELHAIGDGQFNVLTFSFSEEALRQETQRAGLPITDNLLGGEEVMRVDPQKIALFRRALGNILDTTKASEPAHPLAPNLMRILATTLASAQDPVREKIQNKGQQALAAAVKLLTADHQGVMSIKALAERLQVSPRTLDAAFLDNVGLTPAAYRKALRLNRANRWLHRADPTSVTVKEIAQALGFKHMSQFATDFRAHFGVLPSHSLQVVTNDLKSLD